MRNGDATRGYRRNLGNHSPKHTWQRSHPLCLTMLKRLMTTKTKLRDFLGLIISLLQARAYGFAIVLRMGLVPSLKKGPTTSPPHSIKREGARMRTGEERCNTYTVRASRCSQGQPVLSALQEGFYCLLSSSFPVLLCCRRVSLARDSLSSFRPLFSSLYPAPESGLGMRYSYFESKLRCMPCSDRKVKILNEPSECRIIDRSPKTSFFMKLGRFLSKFEVGGK